MGLRKTDYYIKLILNSTIEDLVDIQDQIENDQNLSTEELEWLEISIADLMSKKSHINLRLVNKITGLEEKHTQITNSPRIFPFPKMTVIERKNFPCSDFLFLIQDTL